MKSKIFVNVVANAVLILVVAAIVAVGFYGTVSNAFNPDDYQPIYRGSADKPNVSLMINVYWGTEYLDGMLKTLSDNGVRTTFFVGGYWVAQNPEMLSRLIEEGHEIANHGYYHKNQGKIDYDKNVSEIVTNGKLVFELSGVQMNLFAPPSGSFSSNTLKAAYDNGYKTIMWSRDTIDWRDKDSELVYSRATKNTSNGELILMHPTAHTAKALDRIIKYYKENGFGVVTVTQNINGT